MEKKQPTGLTAWLLAIVFFLAVLFPFVYPVLEGKRIVSADTQAWRAQAEPLHKIAEEKGEKPLWAWHIFSGMPALFVSPRAYSLVRHAWFTLGDLLPFPIYALLLGFLFMVYLCLVFREVPLPLAIFGGITVTLATFVLSSIEAGHVTKIGAAMAIPGILGGILAVFNGRLLSGSLVFLLALTALLLSNHLQVLYYTFLLSVALVAVLLVRQLRETLSVHNHPFFHLVKPFLFLGLCTIPPLMVYGPSLWQIQEFARYSIRGQASELAPEKAMHRAGLDYDYAFQWSYGIGETFTLLVPRFAGGGSAEPPSKNSYMAKKLQAIGLPPSTIQQLLPHVSTYWGPMPFTDSPVYMGILIWIGVILALLVRRDWFVWWAALSGLIILMLAWGKHFFLAPLAFQYLPLFNKFRTPMMIFLVFHVVVGLLGVVGFARWFQETNPHTRQRTLTIALTILGGLLGLIGLLALLNIISFRAPHDQQWLQFFAQQKAATIGEQFIEILREQRKRLLLGDVLRNLLLLAGGGLILWATLRSRLRPQTALWLLLLIHTADLFLIGRHYFSTDAYRRPPRTVYLPTDADRQILRDPSYYRVANFTVGNPFVDSRTPYFHKSIGGYLPARLRIYQDLIDSHLLARNMYAYHMLNVKYFIVPDQQGGKPQVILNRQRCGPAWLPKHLIWVANPKEASRALKQYNPCETGILFQQDSPRLTLPTPNLLDSLASVQLVYASPDTLIYKVHTQSSHLLVLSEIYYPIGWHAFTQDGKSLPIVRVNFALRGIVVPPGEHKIWVVYAPTSAQLQPYLEYTGDVLWLGTFLLMVVILWRKRRTPQSKPNGK